MKTWFDYTNQAWVQDDVYVRCGHPGACDCYGTAHEGTAPAPEIIAEYAAN